MGQHIDLHRWSATSGVPPARSASFADGDHAGTSVTGGRLELDGVQAVTVVTDPFGSGGPVSYDYASWTSAVVTPGFALTSLIASWNARTPTGTWVEVSVQAHEQNATRSRWHVLGRWAELDPAADGAIHRTTVTGAADGVGSVSSDTFHTAEGATVTGYRLRVTLHRETGSGRSPSVSLVAAVASQGAHAEHVLPTPVRASAVRVLDVPAHSQRLHVDEYPQWGGGGQAWCSPTSTSMVLAHWGLGPTAQDYAWVESDCADRFVDHAARHTYDHAYGGAGNWPFNAAYAARFGTTAFITRMRSLAEAERFIEHGIPLVVSVAFEENELDGAGYGTTGHLMVLVGFTDEGDVVVNDPNSHRTPSNDEVRAVFDRKQFEHAWVHHSGGVVYVIHPPEVELPPAPAEANW